jgi:hypothetical protein
MSCLTRYLGKSIALGVDVMSLWLVNIKHCNMVSSIVKSFPKNSMISDEYQSPTFLFINFNYVVYFIPLQSYFTSFKIFILRNSL